MIAEYRALSKASHRAWLEAFDRVGTSFEQHPKHAAALDAAGQCVMVWSERDAVSAFAVEGGVATCIFGRHPVLCDGDVLDFTAIAREMSACMNIDLVYFPYCSPTHADRTEGDWGHWNRRPTLYLDWNDCGRSLRERVSSRVGSRADRRWLRFERAGIHVSSVRAEAATSVISQVEKASWKFEARQSMHDRGQFQTYVSLLQSGLLEMYAAFDGDRPIAYRLDAHYANRVFCVKWSFDDAYRRLSPGFYLLTAGLVSRWGDTPLRSVELHGSPDTLKVSIATGSRSRSDMAWPQGPHLDALRADRLEHDVRHELLFAAGQGLRHARELHIA